MKKIRGGLSRDQKIGIFLFLFSTAMYFVIIPYGVEMYRRKPTSLSPSTFPSLITFIIAFFSLLLIFKEYFTKEKEPIHKGETPRVSRVPLPRVIATIGLFIIYLVLAPSIGYLTTSILIMPAFFVLFGTRRKLVIAVLSIGLPALLYWFFAKVMLVMLPKGILF